MSRETTASHFRALKHALSRLEHRVRADPFDAGLLGDLHFPRSERLPRDRSRRLEQIAQHIKDVRESLEDSAFLAITAKFEHAVFSRLRHVPPLVRAVVAENYDDVHPMANHREGFVRDATSFWNLGAIADLLAARPVPSPDQAELARAVKYRDFICHGRRFTEAAEPVGFEQAVLLYERILDSL
jgi:hypothetical protein